MAKEPRKIRPGVLVFGLLLTMAGLYYVNLGTDFISDTAFGPLGFLDDAGVMLLLYLLFRRIAKRIRG